jgi:hypothetical protein
MARHVGTAADGLTPDERLAQAPVPGSEPTDGEDQHAQHCWHERVHQALRTDRRYAECLTATDSPEVYRYYDDAGVIRPVTFTRETADNSAGAIGLLTWQHPVFPLRKRPTPTLLTTPTKPRVLLVEPPPANRVP